MANNDTKETQNHLISQSEENIISSSSNTSITSKNASKKSGRAEFVYNERDRENFYKDLITFHENRKYVANNDIFNIKYIF